MTVTELSSADVDTRVRSFAEDANLGWVADALVLSREQIVTRWLKATADQPFHHGRRALAVADHIPALFDALVDLLRRNASRFINPEAPLDDAAVLSAARAHATERVRQGLSSPDIVAEFRLLRQEIWHALRIQLPDKVPTTDVIAAEMVVNDALDGAITMGLTALQERVEEVREEFLATTIHEVRQPLTAIKGQAQLAARAIRAPNPNIDRVLLSLQQIEAGATRMSLMLSTLLDSSRVVLGDLTLVLADCDLAAVLRESVAEAGPELAGRVSQDILPGVSTTGSWDQDRLKQVFANLLSNALKYSPPNTAVRITVRGDDEMILVAVVDEGIGVAADDLPRLFERYSRARDVKASNVEGFGLGLYLCQGIVEAHGGRIWAESPGAGLGTTIHVSLPRAVPSSSAT